MIAFSKTQVTAMGGHGPERGRGMSLVEHDADADLRAHARDRDDPRAGDTPARRDLGVAGVLLGVVLAKAISAAGIRLSTASRSLSEAAGCRRTRAAR
jgi:hypothetical protein